MTGKKSEDDSLLRVHVFRILSIVYRLCIVWKLGREQENSTAISSQSSTPRILQQIDDIFSD